MGDWAGARGAQERDVALAAEQRMRELGAEGPSFPAIVAAGENGALPHAEAGEREIGAGELVMLDMGAIVDGYCSDCTRTFATGDIDVDAREVYELVLEAQTAALEVVRAGWGKALDAVARELIAAAGHGDEFGHGLGHGVGIEVHEAPRLGSRTSSSPATSSPSSRASTCAAASACGSRTWSASRTTAATTSPAARRSFRSSADSDAPRIAR